jgi:hypothetical protein
MFFSKEISGLSLAILVINDRKFIVYMIVFSAVVLSPSLESSGWISGGSKSISWRQKLASVQNFRDAKVGGDHRRRQVSTAVGGNPLSLLDRQSQVCFALQCFNVS